MLIMGIDGGEMLREDFRTRLEMWRREDSCSLAIKRLKLRNGDEREITVIYLDLLAGHIVPVSQKYIRLSDSKYHYKNVPNDFEAEIEVDEFGLVANYPGLFVRTAKLESHYQ